MLPRSRISRNFSRLLASNRVERLLKADDTNLDDAATIRLSQKGDREAFGRLVIKYQDGLYNAVYRMTGRREDAADIVQETFLKAYRAIGSFRGGSAIYTWLYQIAVNTVISKHRRDAVRKESKKIPLGGRDGSAVVDPDDGRPEPDVLAQQAELGRRIEQAIAELDEDHRIVVVLKDVEGFDYEQIAQIVGCPRGTVKSRLHRARLKLRERLTTLVE